jgi:vancomycin permeability regulator SanA
MKRKKIQKIAVKCLIVILILGLMGASAVFGINGYVIYTTSLRILPPKDATQLENVDCILVLGCLVHNDGEPSDMLADRLRRGVELYDAGAGAKLLMSGDHGRVSYNEVQSMKQYAMDRGVDSSDIFMDHAGFSTYESLYRAKDIFQAKKILIVTQEYHLYRALYVAEALGLEAYGVSADYRSYTGQTARDIREILARNKDFLTAIFQPNPTYLGETVPISGDGNLTND